MADTSYSITQTGLPEILERITDRGIMKAGDINTSVEERDLTALKIDCFPNLLELCTVNLNFIEVDSGSKSLSNEY